MSLHETDRRQVTFVKPKNGKFVVKQDGEEITYEAVEGTLESVRVYDDEGNPGANIQPSKQLVVRLSDGDDLYDVRNNVERNFSHSLSVFLEGLTIGEEVKLRAVPSTMNESITFCNVMVKDETDNWIRASKVDMAKEKSDRTAYLIQTVESNFTPEPTEAPGV